MPVCRHDTMPSPYASRCIQRPLLTSHEPLLLLLLLVPRGDFIVVGDLMKSISLLQYKPSEVALEVRGRDLSSRWLTALAALDEDTYLAADNECNLVRGPHWKGA